MAIAASKLDPTDRDAALLQLTAELGVDYETHRAKLNTLISVIDSDELLLSITTGVIKGNVAESLIAVTDQHLIVLQNTSAESALTAPLTQIARITGSRGLVTGQIKIELQPAAVDLWQELNLITGGLPLGRRGMKIRVGRVHNGSVLLFLRHAEEALRQSRASTRRERLAEEHSGTDTITSGTSGDFVYTGVALKALTDAERSIAYQRMAVEIGDHGVMTRSELDHLPRIMMPDERLLWFASGMLQSTGKELRLGGFALIALTDRRILLLDKKFLAGVQTIAIDLDHVNSITGDTGLTFGNVKIQDGGDERKIGLIENNTVQPFVARVQKAIQERKQFLHQQQAAAIAAASTPPVTPSVVNVADQLERLAALMERGFLTPEEFAQQKAKLLDS